MLSKLLLERCSCCRPALPPGACCAPHGNARPARHRTCCASAAAANASGSPAPREVAVLGGEDFIYSQRSGVSEELFKGSVLGVNADVARTDFRQTALHSLAVSGSTLLDQNLCAACTTLCQLQLIVTSGRMPPPCYVSRHLRASLTP